MALVSPVITNWVTNSSASIHTTSDAGNLTFVFPPHTNDLSSIIVGNISSLPVTLVGDTTLPDPFYLNNVPVTPDNASSHVFFSASSGVVLRMSCLYTSPQNGKAERTLHSINNMIHSLLF
jgi:hypothetical protein